MVVPAGYISLLDAVKAVAADLDPEAMKATRPLEVAAWERAQKYQAALAASVSITNAAGKKYRLPPKPAAVGSATREYDNLSPESRAKVDRLVAGVQAAATSPPHPRIDWAQIEERQRKAMDDARARLLQALADGVLQAQVRDADGYPHDVPTEPWCGRGANGAAVTGVLACQATARHGELVGRVEISRRALDEWRGAEVDQVAQPTLASPRNNLVVYSDDALGAWFVFRSRTWPTDTPPPSEIECMAAARNVFRDLPGRDKFREIRRRKVSPKWLKTGPKRPAKSSQV